MSETKKEHNRRKLREKDKRKYGIDREEVFIEQEGKCLICEVLLKAPYDIYTHADHDHTTGEFRGLLCSTCNTGLGKFKDSIILLNKAMNYLEERR
jgi:hypothetical protein